MDALASINGLSQVSSTIGLGPRAPAGRSDLPADLPVDYEAITKGGSAATNYQIMPGDRVFIAQDDLIAAEQASSTSWSRRSSGSWASARWAPRSSAVRKPWAGPTTRTGHFSG